MLMRKNLAGEVVLSGRSADPVAAAVRAIMADRNTWIGTASGLLRAVADLAGDEMASRSAHWPKYP
jgi:hypothetical protein